MHRFYLPRADCQGNSLSLTGREAHHALHVLRLRPGHPVTVLDGEGQTLRCELTDSARDRLSLKVLERRSASPLPCQITLAQAVPKGKLFDEIIQKATELGASRIVPLVTQRTVGKFDDKDQSNKLAKWRLVAIEAIKQCGSAWLPRVEPPVTIERFISQQKTVELPLVGSLAEGALHPRKYFEAFESKHGRSPKSIAISIGPEGDFTPEELSRLQSAGALPITLGPLVLRTDTASIYCLSIVNYELTINADLAPGVAH